jgi:tetratricopeptide (TPR) repeat protein
MVKKEGRKDLRNYLAMWYNNRGSGLSDEGKLEEAIEDCGRAIEICEEIVKQEGRWDLAGNYARSLFNRGLANLRLKRPSIAREGFDTALGLLHEQVSQARYGFLPQLLGFLGDRCNVLADVGGAESVAVWANDAMRWTLEILDSREPTPILLQRVKEFLEAAGRERETLVKVGLDVGLYERLSKWIPAKNMRE